MGFFLQNIQEADILASELFDIDMELQNTWKNDRRGVTSSFVGIKDLEWFAKYGDKFTKNITPVGTIEYVERCLDVFHGIKNVKPIEIPEVLRLPHLLLRDYQIVSYDEIPRTGRYFVKNVTRPKSFCYCGTMQHMFAEMANEIDRDAIYQVSDILDLISEYRVFVLYDKIMGIQFYDGDPLIMPTPNEIKKIYEAVMRYVHSDNCPKAFTMDVGITQTNSKEGRDLAIIECHPFSSVGTYGLKGPFLIKMYEEGFKWFLQQNN